MAAYNDVDIIGVFQYRDAHKTPAAGKEVYFYPLTREVSVNGVVTLATPYRVVLNTYGEIPSGFTLPAMYTGSTFYKVREQFTGGRDPYVIELTPTTSYVDLSQVVPYTGKDYPQPPKD